MMLAMRLEGQLKFISVIALVFITGPGVLNMQMQALYVGVVV